MKVVLTWRKQNEMGKLGNKHTEIFNTYDEAYTRALEIGKEFVPDAKNTEELTNCLIALEEKGEPNMYFDIDTIKMTFCIGSENASGMSFKTKEDFLKKISLMIDVCEANGGTQFDIMVKTDASCYHEENK